MGLDLVPFIDSPFRTKVEWAKYAALPVEERLTHTSILGDKLGMAVKKAWLRDDEKMGGMSSEIKFLEVELTSGERLALVLKYAAGNPRRAALGNAREARFYNELASQLSGAAAKVELPRCFYAYGDMASGAVTMLMEALDDAVPSGVFFGAAQPNNWSVRDRLPELCAGNPGPEESTRDAFGLYARLHAVYWGDASLLDKAWLRGAAWHAGMGKASWAAAQAQAQAAWAAIRPSIESGESPITWSAHLVACLDASFAKADWAAYQAELAARPYTLVHGDAHAHNFLWVHQRTPRARQCLIDFEMAR